MKVMVGPIVLLREAKQYSFISHVTLMIRYIKIYNCYVNEEKAFINY